MYFDEGHASFLQGDLVQAQKESDEALQKFETHDSTWAWRFRMLGAEVRAWRGLNAEALDFLGPELPPSAPPALAIRKDMLRAFIYLRLGRFSEAEQGLDRADEVCRRVRCELDDELANVRGILALKRNQLDQADDLFRKTIQLALAAQDRFVESMALLNLSTIAIHREHYDESIDWANRAYQRAVDIQARQIEEKAQGNLGWAYYKLGDFEKAITLYEESEKRAHTLGLVYDEIKWLSNRGEAYADSGRPTEAEKVYQQALDLAHRTQNPEEEMYSASALAFASLENNRLDAAARYRDQAFELAHARADRLSELYLRLVQAKIAAQRGDGGAAEHILREVAADPQSDHTLRWGARDALGNLFAGQHRVQEADATYREAIVLVETARSCLRNEESRLPFLANASQLYDHYIQFLIQQGQIERALQKADYSRAKTLQEGLRPQTCGRSSSGAVLDPRQVARREGSTVLFYWLGTKQSYLWTITAQGVRLSPLPAAADIDEQVRSFQKALRGPRDVLESGDAAGTTLYQTLLGPAKQLLPPGSRVIIIPDGSLNTLNFETLPVPGLKPHYWIEDVTILNASSLRMLAASHQRARSGGEQLLLIGDPVVPQKEYGKLPNAKAEMASIGKHFLPVRQRVLSEGGANPTAYLASSPETFSYIHFVAHGTASRVSPLDSAVVLSQAGSRDDSFKLYAREIIQHPLRAELVTISSCYGAGFRTYTGEGLVGLSWAFLHAGAHHVIGALWEVSDDSTPQLMDRMYEEIEKGKRPEQALRNAKLSLLHSGSVFRKPFYWAPFQLYAGS